MERAIKNWWMWVLMGILYIIMSGYLFISPLTSFIVLSQFMVAFFFVTGVFEVIYSLTNRHVEGWVFNLIMGILQVFIGAYLIKHANEGLPEMMMIFLFMFWLIFYGISAITFSFSLKRMGVASWWLTLVIGILGLLLGLSMSYSPLNSIEIITTLIGAYALVAGIYSLYFGFAIRRHRA